MDCQINSLQNSYHLELYKIEKKKKVTLTFVTKIRMNIGPFQRLTATDIKITYNNFQLCHVCFPFFLRKEKKVQINLKLYFESILLDSIVSLKI